MNEMGQQGGAPQGGFGQAPAGAGGLKPHRGPLLLGIAIGGVLCALLAPVAFFLARGDLREIEAGAMDPEGKQLTTIAYWLGLVWSVLLILGICLNIVSLVLSVAMS